MARHDVDLKIEEIVRTPDAEFSGSVGGETVRRCVADARARFADARIDAFLPLFVAKRARELLRAGGAGARMSGLRARPDF